MTGLPTIFHAILQHQLGTLLARFPPWRDVPTRWLPTEFSQVLVSLVEDSMLLLEAHSLRVLVTVAVQASVGIISARRLPLMCHVPLHLMPSISYHCTLLRKSLKRMPRNEPCGLDVVFREKLQKPANANSSREQSCSELSYSLIIHGP